MRPAPLNTDLRVWALNEIDLLTAEVERLTKENEELRQELEDKPGHGGGPPAVPSDIE